MRLRGLKDFVSLHPICTISILAIGSMLAVPLALRRAPVNAVGTTTEKVILVVWDGLRLQESYKWDQFPNPVHPAANHTPNLTQNLFPQGTLYTNAQGGAHNTFTTPGNNTILTGYWHRGPNRGRGPFSSDLDYVDNRPLTPTIFETLRRDKGLPVSKVVGITDKRNTRVSNYSLHPLYGPGVGPLWDFIEPMFNAIEPLGNSTFIDPAFNSDLWVYEDTIELLETEEPDFLYVSLGLVDLAGHSGRTSDIFSFYTDVIENADQLTWSLWQFVQTLPAYSGKTTMIVTTDHGRHEDHVQTAYNSHKGTCTGCRDLLMFVVGPDTPPGQVVTRRVWQTDVSPTVAKLLDVDLPYATGQPLFEALGLDPVTQAREYITGLDADNDGEEVVAVYREHKGGHDSIRIGRGGLTNVVVGDPGSDNFLLDDPSLLIDEHGYHVAYWQWTEAHHRIKYARSVDGGVTFPEPHLTLAKGKVEQANTGPVPFDEPILATIGGDEKLIVSAYAYFLPIGSVAGTIHYDDGLFGGSYFKTIDEKEPNIGQQGFPKWKSWVEGSNGELFCAYAMLKIPTDEATNPFRSTWEIFFKDFTNTGPGQAESIRLNDNNSTHEMMPSLTIERTVGDTLYIVYAGQVIDDGPLQIFMTRSTNPQKTLWTSPVQVTVASVGAWEPQAVILDGTLHVVYSNADTGEGDIYHLEIQNDVIMVHENLSTDSGLISRNPRLVLTDSGALHAVWEQQKPTLDGFEIQQVQIN